LNNEKVPKVLQIIVICANCQRPFKEEEVDRSSGEPICKECLNRLGFQKPAFFIRMKKGRKNNLNKK
jgi:recombinational DNA repair protein (RecF pathway)